MEEKYISSGVVSEEVGAGRAGEVIETARLLQEVKGLSDIEYKMFSGICKRSNKPGMAYMSERMQAKRGG